MGTVLTALSALNDEELVRGFERATLPPAAFDHAAHVRVGWWYLRHGTLGEALDRFSRALRAFAAAHGAVDKYHETVTVAWMLLIAARLADDRECDWPTFAARHPDLLTSHPSILSRYYRQETLSSARAKLGFVMPDRAGSGAPAGSMTE